VEPVLVIFHDGEVLHARIADLSLALPVLDAEITGVDPNNERALVPLSAIRMMIVGEIESAPGGSVLESWDRAAFHFVDGQVLRARISPDTTLGVFGGTWVVVEPDSDERRRLAIPYSSLKGVFQLRSWDSRPAGERAARAAGAAPHLDQVVRALAERESQTGTSRPRIPAAIRPPRIRATRGETAPSE
jgi:hypothetical protein